MSNKVKILIMVSVLLNVLLIGVVIGHVSHRFGRTGYARRPVAGLKAKLPAEKERLLSETLKRLHRENREIRREIRETREKAMSILTAPEFDEAAYQAEADRIQKLRRNRMQALADATRGLARRFTQEERKALAEILRRPPPRPDRGGPDRHRGPPPTRE